MLALATGISRVGSVSVQPIAPTAGVAPRPEPVSVPYVPRSIVPPPPEVLTYGQPKPAPRAESGHTPVYAPAPSGNIPEYVPSPSSIQRQSIQKLA